MRSFKFTGEKLGFTTEQPVHEPRRVQDCHDEDEVDKVSEIKKGEEYYYEQG